MHVWTGDVYGDEAEGTVVSVQADVGEPAVFYRKDSEVGGRFVKNLEGAGLL